MTILSWEPMAEEAQVYYCGHRILIAWAGPSNENNTEQNWITWI